MDRIYVQNICVRIDVKKFCVKNDAPGKNIGHYSIGLI